jgi:hypothetical protein
LRLCKPLPKSKERPSNEYGTHSYQPHGDGQITAG